MNNLTFTPNTLLSNPSIPLVTAGTAPAVSNENNVPTQQLPNDLMWQYDPQTQQWIAVSDPLTALRSKSNENNAPTQQLPNDLMWQYDPQTQQWIAVPDPLTALRSTSNSTDATASPATQSVANFSGVTSPEPFQGQQPSIVSGLFPEVDAMQRALYDQGRQKEMQAQALQFARLSPMEQAQYGLYLGGQQLGGAIGSALGAQDPQLQRISMRHAILRELDPSDPNQQLQVAQRIAQLDPEFAMQIADNARKAAIQIQQANKERVASVPADIQKAQLVSQLEDALDQYRSMPASPERDRAMKVIDSQLKVLKTTKEATPAAQLQVATRISEITKQQANLSPDSQEYKLLEAEKNQLQRPEKTISVGSDAERIALELFNKNYGDLTQEERGKVNKRIEVEAAAKAPKVQVDLKDPTAVAKASLDVMTKWENFIKQDVEVANRFKALQSSIALAQAGNPSADGATIFNIGKIYDPSGAVQEGDKNTILGNPSIPQKIKGYAQRVFEGGSLTPEQRTDLLNIGNSLIKGRQDQLQIYRKQYINKNKALGGDESDIFNPYEGLIKPSRTEIINQIPTNKTPAPAPQGKTVKKWSDL